MKDTHIAYWVDLQSIQFEEAKPDASWLQAFPIGEYKHPLYGKIVMTFERAALMASQVIKKVRGVDIAIDYGHKAGEEAAGWVTSAEARQGTGLWLFVEWTEQAAKAIRTGQYRYFSPEYANEWQDPKTGTKFKDVLLGGGLTNRPFLKDIAPVNLSEILDDGSSTDLPEGGGMEKLMEALRKQLKLAEDASEEDFLKALTEAFQETEDEEKETVETLTEEEVAKILEEHPAMAKVLDQNKSLADQNRGLLGRVVNLESTARTTSVAHKMSAWHEGGETHKFGVPVALDEKIKAFMLSLETSQVDAFVAIMDEFVKTGTVPLAEKPVRRTASEREGNVLTEVDTGIKKVMDENEGMSYNDASKMFFRDNEQLYEDYLEGIASLDEEVDA